MSSQPQNHLKYWLALNCIPELGPVRWQVLLSHFPSILAVWQAPASSIIMAGIEPRIAAAICKARQKINPDAELEKIHRLKLNVVTIQDDTYPTLLKSAYAPPMVLYYRGTLPNPLDAALGIVGSRKMSSYGKYVTSQISGELASAGITVVSGLALGVDASAHQVTLDARGKTYAVLGNGLDAIYPRTNIRLAQRIIDSGGGVLSEFPPGTLPFKSNFPQRNRVIAGISRGVLVTEAAMRSGSLITARFALEFGRDVFAVPGDINRENTAGTNELLKHGAAMVTCADDIMSAWGIVTREKNKTANEPLSDDEQKIISHLTEPMHVDKIAALARLDISAANAALTVMEIKGIVTALGGNIYAKR